VRIRGVWESKDWHSWKKDWVNCDINHDAVYRYRIPTISHCKTMLTILYLHQLMCMFHLYIIYYSIRNNVSMDYIHVYLKFITCQSSITDGIVEGIETGNFYSLESQEYFYDFNVYRFIFQVLCTKSYSTSWHCPPVYPQFLIVKPCLLSYIYIN
jgi:hypothetical protein